MSCPLSSDLARRVLGMHIWASKRAVVTTHVGVAVGCASAVTDWLHGSAESAPSFGERAADE